MKRNIKMFSTALVSGVLALSLSAQKADSEEVIELEESVIVSTGTRTDRQITEAPVKTELLLADDFDDYNVSSLKDALKLIPTARFENDCQNCGLNQIQLLGLPTDYTAILFDGAPLYSGLAKVYGADLFPAIFIDRIEIVKGGSSVLYGPEAIAGVVNLITAEPFESGFEVDAGFSSVRGDTSDWETSFIGDHVSEDGTFRMSGYGYYTEREGLDLGNDGFTEMPEFDNTVIGIQSWWNPSENTQIKTTYQFTDQAHRGGDSLNLSEEEARVAESLAHEIHIAQVAWEHEVSSDFDYSLGLSYINIERESFYGAREGSELAFYTSQPGVNNPNFDPSLEAPDPNRIEPADYQGIITAPGNQAAISALAHDIWSVTENEVLFIDTQFNHYRGDHTVSYGVQFRHEELEDGPLFPSATNPTPSTEDDFSNLSFYIQDQWVISPELELVSGLRIDDHDNVDDLIFSPRLAARYFASDELTLRASWSTGFNAPGAFNEDQHIGVSNGEAITLVNGPGLEEERSQTFSFGGEYRPDDIAGALVLHSQIHFTLLTDTFQIDDSGSQWLRENGPDSEIFVWENNINWQLTDHLRLDAGLSYIHARLDESEDYVTGLTTDEFIKRPEWTGHFGLAYENHDLFNAHALLNYTGEMLATGEDADIFRRTESFYVLDVGISKEFHDVAVFDHVTVAAGIDNLFDERQKDFQDNGEARDVTYFYGPTQPRTFYLKVSAKF